MITKEKVQNQLIKWGNNPKEVEKMISEGFEFASKRFSTVKKVAHYLSVCY